MQLASRPCRPTGRVAASEARRLLPEPFLRRIVGKLAAAGPVVTARGPGDGIRLARPAAEISLLDVVRALEGGVVLNRCVDSPEACPLADACPVQRQWTRVTRNLEADLATVRFSDLATSLEQRVSAVGYPPVVRAGDELPVRPGRRRD